MNNVSEVQYVYHVYPVKDNVSAYKLFI